MLAKRVWTVLPLTAVAVLVLGGFFARHGSAHEGHGQPAMIQAGACDSLGASAFTLVGVGAVEDTDGLPISTPAAVGPESAAKVKLSVSTIDATVDQLVSAGNSIVVYHSDDEMDNIVACGEIGGIQLGDDLIVGLKPVGEEGETGIALLRTSGAQSTVTLIFTGGGEEAHEHEEEASPEA